MRLRLSRTRLVRLLVACAAAGAPVGAGAGNAGFVQREGVHFILDGRPFHFAGFNNYYQMVFAADPALRPFVDEVQEEAAALGLTVLRTWAFNDGADQWHALQIAPGVYDEAVFRGLDYVLHRADSLGLRVILPLVNNWDDYGGMNQYVEWSLTVDHHDDFYTDANCRAFYRDHAAAMIGRVNTFNGRRYGEDPTIFAWELANEPRCNSDPSGATLQAWIEEMSAHIKSLDPLHMVTTGSEGFYGPAGPDHNPAGWFRWVGVDFVPNHQPETIDFATVHVYPESWGLTYAQSMAWVRDHIQDCAALVGKPVVLEEFGKQLPLATRDLYFQGWYDEIHAGAETGLTSGGSNFWILYHDAYPDYDGFGVYCPAHASTLAIIRAEAERMAALIPPSGARDPAPPPPRAPLRLLVRPNPAPATATVEFALASPERVRLEILDPAGRRVRLLADGPFAAGSHRLTWNGDAGDGLPSAPGAYFCRLRAAGAEAASRLVLLR